MFAVYVNVSLGTKKSHIVNFHR